MPRHKQSGSAWRRGFTHLGSNQLWRWGLFWFAAIIYGLFTFLMDFLRTSNPSWLWFVTYTISLAVATFMGYAASLVMHRIKRVTTTVFANIGFGLVIGGFKNLTVAVFAVLLGLESNVDLAYRFLGGMFMGSLLLVTFALVTGARGEHARAVATLRRIQDELLGSRDNLHIVLTEELERLMERSRETVMPKLQQISALLNDESDNKRVIAELRGTVNDDLRPLMADISDRASRTIPSVELETVKSERVRLPEELQLKQVIRPFITTAYLLGSWMFIGYYFFELQGVLHAVGAGIAYAASLFLIRALVPNRSIKRGRVILSLVIISILAQVFSLFIIGLLPMDATQSVSIPIILFATGIFTFTVFTYLFIVDTERIKLEVQIAAENKKLSKEVTVFEQRLWVFKRKWLFMLHGTVQSALTAALTRLQTFSDSDPYQSALVRADLERAEKALSSEPETTIDFTEAVLELKQAWQGVCAVTVEVDLRADRALQLNQGSAYCVNEILKEAIGNAVRHGGANAVRAVIARVDDDVLDIEIQNDGKSLPKKWKKGIGSRMLDDITTDWTLRHSGRLTTLTARLPI